VETWGRQNAQLLPWNAHHRERRTQRLLSATAKFIGQTWQWQALAKPTMRHCGPLKLFSAICFLFFSPVVCLVGVSGIILNTEFNSFQQSSSSTETPQQQKIQM
jgi:hypothetical protein